MTKFGGNILCKHGVVDVVLCGACEKKKNDTLTARIAELEAIGQKGSQALLDACDKVEGLEAQYERLREATMNWSGRQEYQDMVSAHYRADTLQAQVTELEGTLRLILMHPDDEARGIAKAALGKVV